MDRLPVPGFPETRPAMLNQERRHMTDIPDSFLEGADAKGGSKTANPYPLGSKDHKSWSEGWQAANDLEAAEIAEMSLYPIKS